MRALIFLTLALASMSVNAQTMVLACKDPWGAADNCGGCGGLIWSSPDANDKVKTSDRSNSAFQYWTRLGDLPASAPISVGSGAEGAAASCSSVTGTKTAGELLGTTSIPTPPTPTPAPANGSVTLKWSAPITNIDGSALMDLAGYRIRYGTSQANFDQLISLSGAGLTTYIVNGLSSGTYYFVMTAVNAAGAESPYSNPVSAAVTASTPAPTPEPIPVPISQWVVAPVSSGSRPVYEAVLNAAGAALVRGNAEGQIASGKSCGAEVFKVSTNSYRAITEGDATLDSPTYKGRKHVAICALAK